jgi:hypothetical protein
MSETGVLTDVFRKLCKDCKRECIGILMEEIQYHGDITPDIIQEQTNLIMDNVFYLCVDDDEARIEFHETKDTIGDNIQFYYTIPKGRKLIIDPETMFKGTGISHIYELLSALSPELTPTNNG